MSEKSQGWRARLKRFADEHPWKLGLIGGSVLGLEVAALEAEAGSSLSEIVLRGLLLGGGLFLAVGLAGTTRAWVLQRPRYQLWASWLRSHPFIYDCLLALPAGIVFAVVEVASRGEVVRGGAIGAGVAIAIFSLSRVVRARERRRRQGTDA